MRLTSPAAARQAGRKTRSERRQMPQTRTMKRSRCGGHGGGAGRGGCRGGAPWLCLSAAATARCARRRCRWHWPRWLHPKRHWRRPAAAGCYRRYRRGLMPPGRGHWQMRCRRQWPCRRAAAAAALAAGRVAAAPVGPPAAGRAEAGCRCCRMTAGRCQCCPSGVQAPARVAMAPTRAPAN